MVKYRGSIFIADYWAQSEPGKKPKPAESWALHDELYGTTSSRPSDSMKVISYLPVWRQQENFPYGDATKYKSLTHVILSFLMFHTTTGEARLDPKTSRESRIYLTRGPICLSSLRCQTHDCCFGGATDSAFLDLSCRTLVF